MNRYCQCSCSVVAWITLNTCHLVIYLSSFPRTNSYGKCVVTGIFHSCLVRTKILFPLNWSMLLLFILVYVFPILKWKTLIYCFKALPYLREQLYLWMISIKTVNKVQYQWGKYCVINICSLDGLWMSLTFFFLFLSFGS